MTDTSATKALIQTLTERSNNTTKVGRVRRRDNEIWGYPGITISSWKFNEWDYYNPKADLPTQARGLFTLGDDRILIRGYNKFFNIGEVPATNLDNIKNNTTGPYAATVKENGCIVLITGLNGKLVVTSKHSSGPIENSTGRNHSEVGREWVLKHLETAGRTEEQLANVLEEHNWTAAGELCDDSFEEHVLAYSASASGIYLNGLNHNCPGFETEPPAVVNAFGAEWGFLKTEFTEFSDFDSLHSFLVSCAETGKWQDREIEGFVVRCKLNREDFFFKYKFEEPYLMYRQWREVTKVLLSKGKDAAIARARRSRHQQSSINFLAFAKSYIETHRELRAKILFENLGIIELREQFLSSSDWSEQQLLEMSSDADPRWVVVPVATVGCGKTTVALALNELFGADWSHVQNDSIMSKKARWKSFLDLIVGDLETHRVVIVDRNNAQRQEREKITTDVDAAAAVYGFGVRYVCLNFLPQGPTVESKALTRQRVQERGDNHQTIKSAALNQAAVHGILSSHESRFETVNTLAVPDDQFDLVIDLEPGETKANVVRVIRALGEKYEDLAVPAFSDADIDAAVEKALAYRPDIDAIVSTSNMAKKPNYFAVSISPQHHDSLVELVKSLVPGEILQKINIQPEFHVTLAHIKEHKKKYGALLRKYKEEIGSMDSDSVLLGAKQPVIVTELRWTKYVIVFKVQVEGSANKHAHITVGTAPGVEPMKANYVLEDGYDEHIHILSEPILLEDQALTACA